MGPTGERLKLKPSCAIACPVEHAPASFRGKTVDFIDMHLLAAGPRLFCEWSIDEPFLGVGNPDHERPIKLLGGSPGECLREMPGCARGSRDKERSRRVLVEPVNELWSTALVFQSIKKPVEMLMGLGSPWVASPGGLLRTKAALSS